MTVRTTANEDVIIAAAEQLAVDAISHGNWSYISRGPSAYSLTMNWIHITNREAHAVFI